VTNVPKDRLGLSQISGRFYSSKPFEAARRHAHRTGTDLAVPNGPGIGDILCFTRLVEDIARSVGRPVRLLTAPMELRYGAHLRDGPFPIWDHNPFIDEIVNSDDIDEDIMREVILEKDNHFQFSHVIFNIGRAYGFVPTTIRPSLFLSLKEMQWAFSAVENIQRPLVCLLPASGSSTSPGFPWHQAQWIELIERNQQKAGFVRLGRPDHRYSELPIPCMDTSVREAFAVIWAADAFVGFDSGLAHAAAAFVKPSVVLWDAVYKATREERKEPGFAIAALSRWGYPSNTNVIILGEKNHEILDVISGFIDAIIRRQKPPSLNG
jgi:hypothetical protein